VWLLDEPYEVDDTSRFAKPYERVFVCDQSTLHRHANATYLPTCYDPHEHWPGDDPRVFPVGFVGGANRVRERYLVALARAGLLGYVIGGQMAKPSGEPLMRGRQRQSARDGGQIPMHADRAERLEGNAPLQPGACAGHRAEPAGV